MPTRTDTTGYSLFLSREGGRIFSDPVAVETASDLSEVIPCVDRVAQAVASGLHAVGFLAYEAAPAFDRALQAHPPGEFPLVWFALYRGETPGPAPKVGTHELGPWRALVEEADYLESVRRLREWIAAGDTYQVNYTIPLEASFQGDPRAWFLELVAAQGTDDCVFIDTGRFKILCVSPELHFRLEDGVLEVRPMKGTRRRGRWLEEDRRLARDLAESEKDRAENVMIVDLLRNDLGRVSETGSVEVTRLFEVERYETVWQMTSTIRSRTRADVPQILGALFPSGSVTGAPKARTMAIINEVEPYPRGVYCGSVGWWSPGGRAHFRVAIRTATLDTQTALARYPVGSGITWGSDPAGEYDECLAKAVVLHTRRPYFELLESIGFDGAYLFLNEHLERLRQSAEYFGFHLEARHVEEALDALLPELREAPGRLKVRVTLERRGAFKVSYDPAAWPGPLSVGLAREPVDETDVFLYHKTTLRATYERASASRPDCGDVLLWNRRGEITESTRANVIIETREGLVTPPVECGLLAGVMRGQLLAEGRITERIVTKDDLRQARALWLVNSVRGWMPVRWVENPP